MAQNQFANYANQYPQHQQASAPHQPQPPYAQQTGQNYDPRMYQQQYQQYHQQYPPGPQFSQAQAQHYHQQPQPPQQHYQQPRPPPSSQPISSSFGQPIPQHHRPPPSPQPPQHQPHLFPNRPPPSPQPQQYFPNSHFTSRPQPSPQFRSAPSPTHEQTTASPRPRYAYLPQQSVFPSGGHSPVSPAGRPLPIPGGRPESMPPSPKSPMPSSISPTRSALPTPASVASVPPLLHRPSISSTSPSKSSAISRFPSRPSSPGHQGRPLPTPIPRSSKTQSLDMRTLSIRTSSPVKGASLPMPPAHEGQISSPTVEASSIPGTSNRIAFPPIAAPGQPFVPHWKRNLPGSHIQTTFQKHSVDMQRRGTFSGIVSAPGWNKGMGLNRTATLSSGRPLPASPVGASPARDGSKQSPSEHSEDIRSQARTPSPQYGILDLPRSRLATRVEATAGQREHSAVNWAGKQSTRSSTLPQPPNIEQSVAFQMASMSIDDNGSRPPKTPTSSAGWPANLPPLPRGPATPSKNGMINLDDAPPPSLRRTPLPSPQLAHSCAPSIPSAPIVQTHDWTPQRTSIQKISFPADPQDIDSDSSEDDNGPMISISVADADSPQISVKPTSQIPSTSVETGPLALNGVKPRAMASLPSVRRGGGLSCGGCGGAIIGRIVSAMGARWHPGCFRCCVCNELLENLSSYEKDGRPYCHLDYHEAYAPKCFHCHTTIVDEQFVTLDDHELGTRTYHEQHFFCAECGDPFLPPSSGNRSFAGDGAFEDDDVGFTVYKGHPYCESCHVRLRMPKCKKCKKSIRDGMKAVEALGGKWCWGCFVCAGCERPFENPSFFQRDNYPFCERCFSIMIRNEL